MKNSLMILFGLYMLLNIYLFAFKKAIKYYSLDISTHLFQVNTLNVLINSYPTPKSTLTPGQLLEYSSEQSRHPQWVWWTVGGYFVSSWFFNIADFFTHKIVAC